MGFDESDERGLRDKRGGFDASDLGDLRGERAQAPQASLDPRVISQAARAPLDPQAARSFAAVARPSHATPIIGAYGGYRKTLAFGYVCLVYHATTLFCRRVYDYKSDPLGKTSGQMVGAARSARQNIVEGSSRAGTSKETELRLYDVARGSLEIGRAHV